MDAAQEYLETIQRAMAEAERGELDAEIYLCLRNHLLSAHNQEVADLLEAAWQAGQQRHASTTQQGDSQQTADSDVDRGGDVDFEYMITAAVQAALIGELEEKNYLYLRDFVKGNPMLADSVEQAWNRGLIAAGSRRRSNGGGLQDEAKRMAGHINHLLLLLRSVQAARNGTQKDIEHYTILNNFLDFGVPEMANLLAEAWQAGIDKTESLSPLKQATNKITTPAIQWPPNTKTALSDLLSLHRSAVPAATGTFKAFIPSINLGLLSNAPLTEPPANSLQPHPLFVVDTDAALVYRGADFVIERSHPGGALLYSSHIDSITHFESWSKSHDRNLPKESYYLKGTTLLIGGTWEENFAHFLTEVLGRCSTFERFGYSFAAVDRVLVSQPPSKTYWAWFRQLGIADKVMVSPHCLLLCERLLLPSLSPAGIPLETIAYLRGHAACRCEGERRIFVARGSGHNGRRLVNEDSFFHQRLQPAGFEQVTMDGMSFQEQASMFRSATHIVAPHGAALANLVFATPNSRVLELFGASYINPCMLQIANQLDIDHYSIVCEEVNDKGDYSDFNIDMETIHLEPFLAG